jgi:hypothetical protein
VRVLRERRFDFAERVMLNHVVREKTPREQMQFVFGERLCCVAAYDKALSRCRLFNSVDAQRVRGANDFMRDGIGDTGAKRYLDSMYGISHICRISLAFSISPTKFLCHRVSKQFVCQTLQIVFIQRALQKIQIVLFDLRDIFQTERVRVGDKRARVCFMSGGNDETMNLRMLHVKKNREPRQRLSIHLQTQARHKPSGRAPNQEAGKKVAAACSSDEISFYVGKGNVSERNGGVAAIEYCIQRLC